MAKITLEEMTNQKSQFFCLTKKHAFRVNIEF